MVTSAPEVRWLGRDDPRNPFTVDGFGCLSFVRAMRSTTKDKDVADRFVALRSSVGRNHAGQLPQGASAIEHRLVYPGGGTADGVLFKAQQMEQKWDIYLYRRAPVLLPQLDRCVGVHGEVLRRAGFDRGRDPLGAHGSDRRRMRSSGSPSRLFDQESSASSRRAASLAGDTGEGSEHDRALFTGSVRQPVLLRYVRGYVARRSGEAQARRRHPLRALFAEPRHRKPPAQLAHLLMNPMQLPLIAR